MFNERGIGFLGIGEKKMSIEEFRIIGKMGEGTFAQIFIVVQKTSSEQYCLKRICKSHCKKHGQMNYIENELEILSKVKSRLFPDLYFAFEDSYYVYFIMEYCPHNLFDLIMNSKHGIGERNKKKYFIQLSFAIAKLHENGYIYRDLKPENVLIDNNNCVKLCDFGYARSIQENETLYELCGSYEYLPPELVQKKGYNKSYDLYCLGLIFYEILTSQNPFKGVTPSNLSEIKSIKINYKHKMISEQARDLIIRLMKKSPEERIGYNNTMAIFKHKFYEMNKQIVLQVIRNDKSKSIQKRDRLKVEFLEQRSEKPLKEGNIIKRQYNYLQVDIQIPDKPEGPKLSQK